MVQGVETNVAPLFCFTILLSQALTSFGDFVNTGGCDTSATARRTSSPPPVRRVHLFRAVSPGAFPRSCCSFRNIVQVLLKVIRAVAIGTGDADIYRPGMRSENAQSDQTQSTAAF